MKPKAAKSRFPPRPPSARSQLLDVHVPPGCRDRVLPLSDPRAQLLTGVGVFMASVSEVVKGFRWTSADPVTHFVLGGISGSGFYSASGRRRPLRPGELAFLPARVSRSFGATSARWKVVTIRLADVPRWRDAARRGVQHVRDGWVRRLEVAIEGMLAEAPGVPLAVVGRERGERSSSEGDSPFDDLLARYRTSRLGAGQRAAGPTDAFVLYAAALRAQLEAMLRVPRDADEDDGPFALERLWARVRNRLDEPWTTSRLARELGVSRPTLHRMVSKHQGFAPRAALDRLRMEEAASLLADSDHSVKVIAGRLGYANAFSFSAAFKRVFRESPTVFRRRVATGSR